VAQVDAWASEVNQIDVNFSLFSVLPFDKSLLGRWL
jgi:hypothetical protein